MPWPTMQPQKKDRQMIAVDTNNKAKKNRAP
jgi:hypothetical protein